MTWSFGVGDAIQNGLGIGDEIDCFYRKLHFSKITYIVFCLCKMVELFLLLVIYIYCLPAVKFQNLLWKLLA